jgi:hypothetical protein
MKRPKNISSLFVMILFVAVLALNLYRTAAAQQPPPQRPTDDEVKALIDQLDTQGPGSFTVRQRAEAKLTDFVTSNLLTRAQLSIIRSYPGNPPLELQQRKERILSRWVTSFAPAREILNCVKFETLERSAGRDWYYKIDGFYGGANTGDPDVTELYKRYEAVRNAVLAADTGRLMHTLTELKNWVDDPNRFDKFYLHHDKDLQRRATRKEVTDKIQQAIDQVQKFVQDIGAGSNDAMPPPRQKIPVQGQGAVNAGRTLRLALDSNPVMPGELDVFMPDYDFALSQPPLGYQFVGELFDILPDPMLGITGTVSLGIEYGQTQLFGNPVVDPSLLRIARLANGRMELLDNYANDTNNFVITGFYTPESKFSGSDQFGEFAVVQPAAVPEPGILTLVGIGVLCLCLYGWRRRKILSDHSSKSPSRVTN